MNNQSTSNQLTNNQFNLDLDLPPLLLPLVHPQDHKDLIDLPPLPLPLLHLHLHQDLFNPDLDLPPLLLPHHHQQDHTMVNLLEIPHQIQDHKDLVLLLPLPLLDLHLDLFNPDLDPQLPLLHHHLQPDHTMDNLD
jgi:hypothetical protein